MSQESTGVFGGIGYFGSTKTVLGALLVTVCYGFRVSMNTFMIGRIGHQ